MHNQPVLKKIALGTLVTMLIFFTSIITVSGQCPEINPEEVEIKVDQSRHQIDFEYSSDVNFRQMGLSLYNMDDGSYYFDSERKKQVVESKGLSVSIRNNSVIINNLSPGDYVIIIENTGCEKQVIGWGYSGLPHSGIRIYD
jgi:hypothetical protein